MSVQVIGGVAFILLGIGAGNFLYDVSQISTSIEDNARKRGEAALDMLESVHTNAMLNRDKTADGDPAIATLDGTMEQFSEQSHGVSLWLVMGPKVVAYQKASGAEDYEGPQDAVDSTAISAAVPQLSRVDDTLRMTRPVILGQGSASNESCAACHTARMDVQKGEVIGLYSAKVDLKPEYAAAYADIRQKAIATVGVFILALLLLSAMLRVTAIRPLRRLAAVTEALAGGDITAESGASDRKDEIGAMARALEVFREAFIRNRALEADANRQREAAERTRVEAQRIAEAEATRRLEEATSGLAGGLQRMARGDLAFEISEPFAQQFEGLRHDFNQSVKQLGETLTTILHSAHIIDNGTREIFAGTDDLARRTEQQAASLTETSSAVDEISATVLSSVGLTDEVRRIASEANGDATKSGTIVSEAEVAMERIETSSARIGNIIGVIDEIAFQTNLLALNAGVEAARAGEAGKGFAVVAQEVRELAQRSANAAKEIKGLISASTTEVGNGVRLVRDAGDALNAIGRYISTINERMATIATATSEQATSLKEVNAAVVQMDQMTQQNAAMVEQTNAASATLASEAAKLRELVCQFRLRDAAQAPARPRVFATPPAAPARPVAVTRPQTRGNLALKPAVNDWEEF
ncbi:methyl-accepting chemotaxis protein [Allorhizobium borbori]|uniref:Methyl-accepting chemotaxis protein n=1 Tax=Allorhizobium borbori TaxID=485907 RepID=A0A7W6K2V2_9HYPH|nr:methyl-accepting chemotaxis protein [Allorhizobium borbori]MBB4104178.1 methyl-accepting chemotaxis protein [Allorhizobium borbori]